MLDDDLVLGAVTRLKWVGDRMSIGDFKFRHIGRAVEFSYGEDRVRVLGTLDKVDGTELIISGDPYEWSEILDFKVGRKVIDNG